MAEIIEFPDVQAERAAFSTKMEIIGQCQLRLARAMREMRENGADTNQIIRILRHAITQLELDEEGS